MHFTTLTLLVSVVATVQARGKQTYSFDMPVGSLSGKTFKLGGTGPITGVRTWENGKYVFGLQLRFGDIWSARVGRPIGYMQEFELYDDEAIIQVSGKFDKYITWLHFGTSDGRVFTVGQPFGQSFNFYPEHYEAELLFVSGTYYGALTGFSTHWGVVTGLHDKEL